MQQMKKETEERALICAEKEGGGFLFLRRLVARLTDGFWEAVVRGFTGNRASLSVEFLGVLCLFSFAFCSALASLAVFPLRTYPVPFALFGAIGGFPVTVGKKECSSFGLSASVVIGVLIASLFLPHGLLLAFFVSALLVLRLLLGFGRLSEGVVFRALFAALFSALYALVSSFYYTSRAASVLNVFCAFLFSGVLTVLFSGVFVRWQAKEGTEKGGKAVFLLLPSQLSLYRTLSFLSFGFCVLYAVREIDFFGFSLSFVAATLACLFVSRLCGGMEGALCGALLGFAAAGEGALCLVVSGLCFSLGLIHSQFAATALSFAASAGFLICFCSGEAFALFAADLLLSHLIFWALLRVLLHRLSPGEQSEPVALRSRAYLQEKLARLSEAFSSLSEVFYMATDARLSKEGELASRLVREASERVCASCRHSTDCHERNYGLTRSALNALSVQLQEKHSVSPADMEPYFKSRCRKA
ncbi:MAG: hypothetical protein II328_02225, partial [Clostridia bacterium]|nr:hypothetical protein [Clostridia bacterium]